MKPRQKHAAARALRPRPPAAPRERPPEAPELAPQAETRAENACNRSVRMPQSALSADERMFMITVHL